ncbi:MAG: class I SAM-dependent methyltransferase [Gammaproteobacteria bacterium]
MMNFNLRALRNWFEARYLVDCGYGSGREFIARLIASAGPGDVVLDVGCGEGRLRQQLSPAVRYIGLDRYAGKQSNEYTNWNMQPTVLGDVHELPFASASCKTVALMHVLEHVRDPAQVFTEISRVLQSNGYLFVDVPFLHEIHHAPHDYYRYTPFALTILAQSAGLEVVDIRPSGGYFRALSHMLEEAPSVIRGTSVSAFLVRLSVAYPLKGLGWVFRKLQYLLDLQDGVQTFTCGYHCIFRKLDI